VKTKGRLPLARTRPFAPPGFGSSLKGALQKAPLKDLAHACLPVARRKGRVIFNHSQFHS
jgi:hypothetical protein